MESKLTAHQLNETAQYCFGDEIEFFHEVSLYWCDKAVMIGAGPGVMALALLEEQDEEFEFDIIDVNTCHWVKAHLEAAGLLHDKIHFIHADSKTWGKMYDERPVTFLIIDGDHSYEGVLGDLRAWYPHVEPKGLIFLHDVIDLEQNGTNGVLQAIQDFDQPLELVEKVGISHVYRKPG